MSKNPQKTGKQPYIPLYIGDWEQDTNMLSLEAEGGWLKVIFKMFKNGKNGVYKISTKGLQNLWRKSSLEIAEIIKELKDAEVCIVDTYEDGFVFINRRMQREYDISQKRSKAVQTRYKQDSNRVQPLEYEYEYSKDSSIGNVSNSKELEPNYRKEEASLPDKNLSQFPKHSDFNGLPELKINSAIMWFEKAQMSKVSKDIILSIWDMFKQKHLTGKKFYADEDAVYTHFLQSLKYEKIEKNGSHKQSSGIVGESKSDEKVRKLKQWGVGNTKRADGSEG